MPPIRFFALTPRSRKVLAWTIPGLLLLGGLFLLWKLLATPNADAATPGAASRPGGSPGGSSSFSGRGGPGDALRPVPVAAQAATVQSLDHTVTALGTAIARATVTVRILVDGQLTAVLFREGQLVRAGDQLAQVDPRPYEVALSNAQGQLERDNAMLQNALVDQERYRGLFKEDSIPRQQLDTQEALVRQLTGTVAADRAQVDSAKLQLSYTRVTSPVSGRVGLRMVDAGNIVHQSDAAGLVLVTQVQPIDVVFPLAQDMLPELLARVRKGSALPVEAFDRDGKTLLAKGRLLSVDNTIDPTTGTVKVKAEFDNRDLALFPNQFLNVKLHLETIPEALTIPTAAVQRGAPGLYSYKVAEDGTVSLRTLRLGFTDGDRVQVLEGLSRGDRVVVDGADKLKEGAKVEVIDPAAKAGKPAGARPGGDRPAGDSGPRHRPAQ